MRLLLSVLVFGLVPAASFAQSDAPTNAPPAGWQQPPLLDAPPPTPAPLPPSGAAEAPTPPPPGYQPQGTQAVPYQYSPYSPQQQKAPGPEVGLMITEAAFGTLTAAGTGVLMYYLLVKPLAEGAGGQFGGVSGADSTLVHIIFLVSFSSVPVAVAQSEINLANGSRYYYSESWPAWLSGLGVEAGVVGLFYLMGGVNNPYAELTLLVGTGLILPLAEMVVINLTKQPRWKTAGTPVGSLLRYDGGRGLEVGLPTPLPVPVPAPGGPQLGLGLTLATGRF